MYKFREKLNAPIFWYKLRYLNNFLRLTILEYYPIRPSYIAYNSGAVSESEVNFLLRKHFMNKAFSGRKMNLIFGFNAQIGGFGYSKKNLEIKAECGFVPKMLGWD